MQFCVIHKESLIAHKMLLIPTAYNIYSTVQKDKLSENYVYWMVLLLLLTDMKWVVERFEEPWVTYTVWYTVR